MRSRSMASKCCAVIHYLALVARRNHKLRSVAKVMKPWLACLRGMLWSKTEKRWVWVRRYLRLTVCVVLLRVLNYIAWMVSCAQVHMIG